MVVLELQQHRPDDVERADLQKLRLIAANDRLQAELAERLEAQQASAAQCVLLRALIDELPDLLYVKDAESRFIVGNKATARTCGQATPDDLVGKTDLDFYPPELGRKFLAHEQRIIESGQPMIEEEEHNVDASGSRWFSTTKIPLRNEKREVIGLVGFARNISERKKAELLRTGQARALEMIAMNEPLEDVFDTLVRLIESQIEGMRGSLLLVDEDATRLRHGAAPSLPETCARAVDGIAIGPRAGSCGTAAFRREPVVVSDIATDPLWAGLRDLAAAHGLRACWSTPILSHRGAVLGTLALYGSEPRAPSAAEMQLVDITSRIAGIAIERKRAHDRIQFMAHHDALTGLPNRTLLTDRLAQAVLSARQHDRWVAAAFVDLDRFKLVNDSLGHAVGDAFLKIAAARMVDCVGAGDTVVRLGGDEFVVILHDQPKDAMAISATLQRIQAAIAEPVEIGGHSFQVTCSIGLATCPGDAADAQALLINADAAMYRAKELGRDNFQFYTPELNATVHDRLALQQGLRRAMARDELVLHYQPQVDMRTGRVFAAEALIRWRHPTLGTVSPATFIPLAEETGLIVPIGDWVLRTACRQNKAWQDAGLPRITVCVNVSPRQFREKCLVSRVADALEESGLEARFLELELTEGLIVQDLDQAIETMRALEALGVQLSVDDFGTGYSSLSALKSFPIARLKIDQSFVRGLPDDESDKAITSAVISLGQKLHLRVIAEGVETDQQFSFLREHGCDEIQGYHFSRPVACPDFERLLRQQVQVG